MASKVKRARPGILKIRLRLLEALGFGTCRDFGHLAGTAFFFAGLQPAGCTKQLTSEQQLLMWDWGKR